MSDTEIKLTESRKRESEMALTVLHAAEGNGKLRDQLTESLKREAVLREALTSLSREARAMLERDECEIDCEQVIEICDNSLFDHPEAWTREELEPLVEALDRTYRDALIANGSSVNLNIIELRKRLASAEIHARKIGLLGECTHTGVNSTGQLFGH